MIGASTHRTRDGVDLSIWTQVGHKRPPFLLVHGLASNARLWDAVARSLNTRGHQTVAVDLRGHGQSGKPANGFDFATMTEDLAGIVESSMSPPVIAVGQSFGGNLAMEFAARHPSLVSSVVCVDGGFVDLRDSWPRWEDARRELTPPAVDHLDSTELVTLANELYPGFSEEAIAAQLANFEISAEDRVGRRLPLDSHLTLLRSMWEHSPIAVARGTRVPVLVLVASAGPPRHQGQVARFANALQQAKVLVLDGHHDLHAQRPDEVVRAIAEALDQGFLR